MIVSILFWLWELSLPVRGAWERGSSWGTTYTEKRKDGTRKTNPRKQSLLLSRTLPGPFPLGTIKAVLPAVGAGRGAGAGGLRAARGRAAAPPAPLRTFPGGFPAGGSGGWVPAPRCWPGGICKHSAGDGRPAGGRRQPALRACCRAARSPSAAAALVLNSWAKKAVF